MPFKVIGRDVRVPPGALGGAGTLRAEAVDCAGHGVEVALDVVAHNRDRGGRPIGSRGRALLPRLA